MSIKSLHSSEFSDEEQFQVVTDLLAMKKKQIRDFLANAGLPTSGTKQDMQNRIEDALADGTLSLRLIVQYLDAVIPWGKQHVYLYRGPSHSIANWKKSDWITKLLKEHRLGKYLNANLPLALPEKMRISSISYDQRRLRVTAIKKRHWWERKPDYDDEAVTEEGDDVELRAFVNRVTRSLVAFEWDLNANTAFLQISQLPTGVKYAFVAAEFFNLIAGWLNIVQFKLVDLRPAIKTLHALEEAKKGETRSHGINYRTLHGRRFEGRSASPGDSLFGEASIDAAMGVVRNSGVGHLGNFYWLPNRSNSHHENSLVDEVHVEIVGSDSRINFPTPNVEKAIRYVLSRIRSNCA